jgi:hypothetical protein
MEHHSCFFFRVFLFLFSLVFPRLKQEEFLMFPPTNFQEEMSHYVFVFYQTDLVPVALALQGAAAAELHCGTSKSNRVLLKWCHAKHHLVAL